MTLQADLVIMLLYARGASGKFGEPIVGVTRLTKLLFLLERETSVKDGFKFIPYKMGPYSPDITPIIEFLSTFPSPDSPLLAKRSGNKPPRIDPEESKYWQDIASDDDNIFAFADQNNQKFELTEKGLKVAETIWNEQPEDVRNAIGEIKQKYSPRPLKVLLKYVYEKYEDMTSESEIKDWVKGNG
jgi:uncharacterized protein YwgA